MNIEILVVTLSSLLIIIFCLRKIYTRSQKEIFNDLVSDEAESNNKIIIQNVKTIREKIITIMPVIIFCFSLLLQVFVTFEKQSTHVIITFVPALLGYLLSKRLLTPAKDEGERQINFYLPLVMERLCMAIESGNSVHSAMVRVVETEKKRIEIKNNRGRNEKLDPVTRKFEQVLSLVDKGVPFEGALSEVISDTDNHGIHHIFTHLGLAFRVGGELRKPLRELADSAQAH